MVQCLKLLPCMYGAQGLDPQNLCKCWLGVAMHTGNPRDWILQSQVTHKTGLIGKLWIQ